MITGQKANSHGVGRHGSFTPTWHGGFTPTGMIPPGVAYLVRDGNCNRKLNTPLVVKVLSPSLSPNHPHPIPLTSKCDMRKQMENRLSR